MGATFRSLRERNYRLYFFGQLISLMGTWMQTTALTWLVFELTHESKWTGWVMAGQILPTFLFGAWAGMLADSFPKRWLILVTQSGFLLLAFLLAGLAYSGRATAWQLLVVTTASGLVQAVDLPARLAYVTDLAGRDNLMNAVALNSLLFNVARAVGPALGGLLLLWFKPWACFLANGLSYFAVLWALVQIDVPGRTQALSRSQGLRSLLAGFAYLASHLELAFLVLLAFSTSFFGWPVLVLLPALSSQVLGRDQTGYSIMLSATGVGALTAALFLATFGSLERRQPLIAAGVGLLCAGLIGLAATHLLAAAIGCCAVIGFGLILFLATSQSVVQLSTSEHNRGRVMGIWAMTLSGAVPLGNFVAGPAADRWGVPVVLLAEGIGCALVALGLFCLFRMRAAKTD